jgi:hypothetical protein
MVVTQRCEMGQAHRKLSLEGAEIIAAQALAFLAAESARLSQFLALTGLTPDDLREQINTPELLSAALDHLARDEPLLLVFATSAQIPPGSVGEALYLLQEAKRRT